ncbi:hypothetical protein [Streptomyces sp. NPDC002851]
MRRPARRAPTDADADADTAAGAGAFAGAGADAATESGMRRLDGYLYWQAELAGARREAAAFCDRLPWLTTGERRDVEDRYTQARAAIAETTTRQIAARCTELRAEYETRYRRLRTRLLAAAIASVLMSCAVAAGCLALVALRG